MVFSVHFSDRNSLLELQAPLNAFPTRPELLDFFVSALSSFSKNLAKSVWPDSPNSIADHSIANHVSHPPLLPR